MINYLTTSSDFSIANKNFAGILYNVTCVNVSVAPCTTSDVKRRGATPKLYKTGVRFSTGREYFGSKSPVRICFCLWIAEDSAVYDVATIAAMFAAMAFVTKLL